MIRQQLMAAGIAPVGTTPAEFLAIMQRDRKFYADAMKAAGIAPATDTSRPLVAK
jgi:hypothetical protein